MLSRIVDILSSSSPCGYTWWERGMGKEVEWGGEMMGRRGRKGIMRVVCQTPTRVKILRNERGGRKAPSLFPDRFIPSLPLSLCLSLPLSLSSHRADVAKGHQTFNVIVATMYTAVLGALLLRLRQVGHIVSSCIQLLESFDAAHSPSAIAGSEFNDDIRQVHVML